MTTSEKIYKGYPFSVIITVNENIHDAITVKIRYRKPGGTSILDKTAEKVDDYTLKADLTAIDNSVDGSWKFWPWVENADGEAMPGDPVTVRIYKEGE